MSQSSSSPAPAAAPARRRRKTEIGVVTSDKMNKTRRVEVETARARTRSTARCSAGGPSATPTTRPTQSHVGDMVEIMETRPLSKLKRWRIVRIVRPGPSRPWPARARRPSRSLSLTSIESGRSAVHRPAGSRELEPRRRLGRDSPVTGRCDARVSSHDPDANPARRGRQHRGQGSDVLQGPRRQRLALQAADRRAWATSIIASVKKASLRRRRQGGRRRPLRRRPRPQLRPAAPTAPTSSSTATPSS